MLITLVDDSFAFNGSTPAYQPLGGAEKAFASLPAALVKRGHVVRAINRSPHAMGIDNVSWVNWEGRRPPITEVLIAFRKPSLLEFTRATNARILWVASPAAYLSTPVATDLLARTNARLVFFSEAQHDTFDGTAPGIARTIAPGVRNEYRDVGPMEVLGKPPIAITTAHPKNGLEWLLDCWLERIQPRVPEAQLHVYSAVLRKAELGVKPIPEELKQLYGKVLGAGSKGIALKAPGGDFMMASDYRHARVHLYPSSEIDLLCTTLLESQAVGVPAVCRPLGAAKERIIETQSGFVADDAEAFADHAIRLLTDDEAFNKASEVARRQARARSWESVASEFETLFR